MKYILLSSQAFLHPQVDILKIKSFLCICIQKNMRHDEVPDRNPEL